MSSIACLLGNQLIVFSGYYLFKSNAEFTGSPKFGRSGGTTGYEIISAVSVFQTSVPSFSATGVATPLIISVADGMV